MRRANVIQFGVCKCIDSSIGWPLVNAVRMLEQKRNYFGVWGRCGTPNENVHISVVLWNCFEIASFSELLSSGTLDCLDLHQFQSVVASNNKIMQLKLTCIPFLSLSLPSSILCRLPFWCRTNVGKRRRQNVASGATFVRLVVHTVHTSQRQRNGWWIDKIFNLYRPETKINAIDSEWTTRALFDVEWPLVDDAFELNFHQRVVDKGHDRHMHRTWLFRFVSAIVDKSPFLVVLSLQKLWNYEIILCAQHRQINFIVESHPPSHQHHHLLHSFACEFFRFANCNCLSRHGRMTETNRNNFNLLWNERSVKCIFARRRKCEQIQTIITYELRLAYSESKMRTTWPVQHHSCCLSQPSALLPFPHSDSLEYFIIWRRCEKLPSTIEQWARAMPMAHAHYSLCLFIVFLWHSVCRSQRLKSFAVIIITTYSRSSGDASCMPSTVVTEQQFAFSSMVWLIVCVCRREPIAMTMLLVTACVWHVVCICRHSSPTAAPLVQLIWHGMAIREVRRSLNHICRIRAQRRHATAEIERGWRGEAIAAIKHRLLPSSLQLNILQQFSGLPFIDTNLYLKIMFFDCDYVPRQCSRSHGRPKQQQHQHRLSYSVIMAVDAICSCSPKCRILIDFAFVDEVISIARRIQSIVVHALNTLFNPTHDLISFRIENFPMHSIVSAGAFANHYYCTMYTLSDRSVPHSAQTIFSKAEAIKMTLCARQSRAVEIN